MSGREIARVEAPTTVATTGEGEIMALLGRAVEAGASVEALERLLALKERVGRVAARRAYFEALASAQREMPEVPTSTTAPIATRADSSYFYNSSASDDNTHTNQPLP